MFADFFRKFVVLTMKENFSYLQLMYVPPNGSVPANQDTSDAPLKKILLWNGAAAWSGIRQGRGVFIKQKCPVSTCAISTNRYVMTI
jgi:hypothetical protein